MSPGTIPHSGQDQRGLCLPWELDPSYQGWMKAGCRSTSAWRGQQCPSPSSTSSSPTLGGSRRGSASFLPQQALWRQLDSGLGTLELWGIPLLQGDAHCLLKVT